MLFNKLIKKSFKLLGLQVTRISKKNQIKANNARKSVQYLDDSMKAGLYRSHLRGIKINTLIDVGAAQGHWTLAAMNIWKDSQYVLMEPLEERESELAQLKKENKNIHVINAAAGNKKGVIPFFVAEDLDGSGIADNGSQARTVQITTIDDEIKGLQLNGPYLIKLDTHGYEVPILTGAKETLRDTSLIIIECYGFQIAPNSLLFGEMCQYMREQGFRLIDVVDIMRREKDMAFWQCDAFFIPSHSAIFNSNTYR